MEWIVRGTLKRINISGSQGGNNGNVQILFELYYKDIFLNDKILIINRNIITGNSAAGSSSKGENTKMTNDGDDNIENTSSKLIEKKDYKFVGNFDANLMLSLFQNSKLITAVIESNNIDDLLRESRFIPVKSIELDLEK